MTEKETQEEEPYYWCFDCINCGQQAMEYVGKADAFWCYNCKQWFEPYLVLGVKNV